MSATEPFIYDSTNPETRSDTPETHDDTTYTNYSCPHVYAYLPFVLQRRPAIRLLLLTIGIKRRPVSRWIGRRRRRRRRGLRGIILLGLTITSRLTILIPLRRTITVRGAIGRRVRRPPKGGMAIGRIVIGRTIRLTIPIRAPMSLRGCLLFTTIRIAITSRCRGRGICRRESEV